ncbi:MAG: F0F1 ATP synthase subunit B [Planctomycetaceae bacterium]|nr:ATP synthase F0 subunit B [Planctomycetota bacterium]NUO17400.1 F0F1 ATP synthase subunit B [Planctomycetaceae bacterium]GIK52019.1 MAG: ATP synthase subunit b [Planctomycetota bacterium]
MRVLKLIALALPVLLAAPAFAAGGVNHDQHGGAGVLQFLPNVLFWEYIAFGIILVVLGGFVFPKLFKQLDARQKGIQDALDKADQVRAEAEVLLKKHEDLMRRANDDAKKITDEAVAAGKQAREKIEQAGQQAAQELKQRAEREVELMTRKAEAELRERAVELALLAAGKVLERSISEDDQRRLAREVVDKAAAMRN